MTLEYSPAATLILQQTPSTLRAIVASIDDALNGLLATVVSPACGAPLSLPLIGVLVAGIGTILVTRRTGHEHRDRHRQRAGVSYGDSAGVSHGDSAGASIVAWIAWGLLAVALCVAWRGTFGLLAAGILWWATAAEQSTVRRVLVAVLALAAIGIGQHIDCLSTQLFPMSAADAPTTPLTPLVLLPLGLFLGLVLISPRWRTTPRPTIFTLAIVLVSVAAFDVVQKSLLIDALLGLGLAWLAIGIRRAPAEMSLDALGERARICLRGGVVPIGMLLLTVFTFERSLTTTAAFAETFVQWSQGFESALLLVSIVASFLAQAALFLVVYPLLPFSVGYLKALVFGAYLVTLFLVGVGADERLIITLPELLIGRAVYYLSVPVLIGIYLDLKQHSGAAPDAKPYLERLRTQINIAGAIASILAPAIYASVAKSPVVTSYFDLLNQLAKTT